MRRLQILQADTTTMGWQQSLRIQRRCSLICPTLYPLLRTNIVDMELHLG